MSRSTVILKVREQLAHWERPALVLFSDSDPIFSLHAAARIAAHFRAHSNRRP